MNIGDNERRLLIENEELQARIVELEAELERARKERDEESDKTNHWMTRHRDACMELEQARKERDDAKANASYNALRYTKEQRYRDALERIARAHATAQHLQKTARDALAGDK